MAWADVRAIAIYARRYHVWILGMAAAVPGLHALVNTSAVLPQQRVLLAVVTPLICAAVVGYCVYVRDLLVRVVHLDVRKVTITIPVTARIVPAILLVAAIACGAAYLHYLDIALRDAPYSSSGAAPTGVVALPYAIRLIGLYIGFFAALEGAFTVFIIKEHIQEKLGLRDEQLVTRRGRPSGHGPA